VYSSCGLAESQVTYVFQSVVGIPLLVAETTIGYLVKAGCRTCRIKPPAHDHLHCSTGMVIEGQAIIECGDWNERQREAVNPVEPDTFGTVVVEYVDRVAVNHADDLADELICEGRMGKQEGEEDAPETRIFAPISLSA
jgi:hypothetical protein